MDVAKRVWIIVTRDLAIRRNPAERAADMAAMLLAAHSEGRLDNFISKRNRPMITYLDAGGRLERYFGGERRGGTRKD